MRQNIEISESQSDRDLKQKLGELDITKSLIEKDKVANLIRSYNRVSGSSIPEEGIADSIPWDFRFIIPALASRIAPAQSEEKFLLRPTAAEFKNMRGGLKSISWILGRFSDNLARKFDKLVERKGLKTFDKVAGKINGFLEYIETVENPREQFISEVEHLYQILAKPADQVGEYHNFRLLRHILKHKNKKFQKDYPLISNLWYIFPISDKLYDPAMNTVGVADKLDTVSPEILEGLRNFLKAHEVNVEVAYIKKPSGRFLAEMFAYDRLRRVAKELPLLLESTYDLIPENGPEFAEEVRAICRSVIEARKSGATESEILCSIFKNLSGGSMENLLEYYEHNRIDKTGNRV